MTRVIHTGDTHIGYRQYHAAERRADFLAAFRQVVDDAIDEGVDAVVHAGDLFHDRRPDLGDLLGTIEILSTLSDASIPFLAIVGNHEGTRDRQWLDLFEALGLATRLDWSGVVVGDVTFYGLDYVPPSQRAHLEYQFEPPETDAAALVSHGLFEPFAHADWDTERLLSESNVAFDVVLLGDNHTPGQETVNGTWVTYCGSTERASAAEREERGYNLVTFDREVRIARRGLDVTREFVFVDVELGEGEGIDRVREQLRQHELADAVVLVTIEGDGEAVTPADVETFATERGALVARVTDRREFDAETATTVSFADPDDAVRERVRELGLSGAARDVDEIVRASKVADTNVRESVESHVRSLLDDGLSSFETAEVEPVGADEEHAVVEDGDDEGEVNTVEESDEDGEYEGGEDATGDEDEDAEAGDDEDTVEKAEEDEGEEADEGGGEEADEDRGEDTEEDEEEGAVEDKTEDTEEDEEEEADEDKTEDTEEDADADDEPDDSRDESRPVERAATASASADGDGRAKPTDHQASFGEFQ